MKKFLWILVLLIVVGGVSIAIYANRHKTDTTTTTDLAQVLGGNNATQQPTDNTQTLPLPNTTAPAPAASTIQTKPVPTKHATQAVAVPTTKTYLIPAAALQVTVPNSWYIVSTTNDASLIVFTDVTGNTVFGKIDIFLGSDRTISTLQSDLMHDSSVYNIRYTTFGGMTALAFNKYGVSGDLIGLVHGGNAYYLEGAVQNQAVLRFTR